MNSQMNDQIKRTELGTIRSYVLQLYGNPGKIKETLGNMLEYRAWLWDYVIRYYSKGELSL